jgi:hypothetical protein
MAISNSVRKVAGQPFRIRHGRLPAHFEFGTEGAGQESPGQTSAASAALGWGYFEFGTVGCRPILNSALKVPGRKAQGKRAQRVPPWVRRHPSWHAESVRQESLVPNIALVIRFRSYPGTS